MLDDCLKSKGFDHWSDYLLFTSQETSLELDITTSFGHTTRQKQTFLILFYFNRTDKVHF